MKTCNHYETEIRLPMGVYHINIENCASKFNTIQHNYRAYDRIQSRVKFSDPCNTTPLSNPHI